MTERRLSPRDLRLPPLDLVRTFVAVGRRMSVTAGAEDLRITQSAASRQLRMLEDMMRVKLFVRGHRSLTFTQEGTQFFRVADDVMRQLGEVVAAISPSPTRDPVSLTASVGVAGLWLLPRIGRFKEQHPEIDIRILADNRVADLQAQSLDLAIRYCPAPAPAQHAERLFEELLAPVAHPDVCRRLESPAQLERCVLLEFDDPRYHYLHWSDWLTGMGWPYVTPKGMLRFNQYDQLIQTAVAGRGIALGRLHLLGSLLASGQLAVLATPRLPSPAASYWLVHQQEEPRRDVRVLIDWIRAQAQETEATALSILHESTVG